MGGEQSDLIFYGFTILYDRNSLYTAIKKDSLVNGTRIETFSFTTLTFKTLLLRSM